MFDFKEDEIVQELHEYIAATYGQHYASDKIQTTEFIMSQFPDGIDFLRGNALKYLARYGLKEGKQKKDLLKAMHYIVLMMYYDFEKENNSNDNDTKKSKSVPKGTVYSKY